MYIPQNHKYKPPPNLIFLKIKTKNWDFEPRFQANYSTYNQTFDVFRKSSVRLCYQINFMKKY